MLSLEVWYSGFRGPDGQHTQSKIAAADAALVALHAELSTLPRLSHVEDLSARIEALTASTKTQPVESGIEHHGVDMALEAFENIEHLRDTLDATSQSIKQMQSELTSKAGDAATQSTVSQLRDQIAKLAAATVGKQQLQIMLKSKVDHHDLRHLAVLIANGELGGLNATAQHSALLPNTLMANFRLQPSSSLLVSVASVAINRL